MKPMLHLCLLLPSPCYAEVPSSISGAISRTSSIRSSGLDASPTCAAGPAQALSEGWPGSLPSSPLASGMEARGGGAAAAAADGEQQQQEPGGAAAVNGSAANGTAGQHQAQRRAARVAPAPIKLPEGGPLPLPIITPVGAVPEGSSFHTGPNPPSAAAAEAADSSPRGGVGRRVQQLEQRRGAP